MGLKVDEFEITIEDLKATITVFDGIDKNGRPYYSANIINSELKKQGTGIKLGSTMYGKDGINRYDKDDFIKQIKDNYGKGKQMTVDKVPFP